MFQLAKPLIVLSSLFEPMTYAPTKAYTVDYNITYTEKEKLSLPYQGVNDVITSEDMLILIIQQSLYNNPNRK